MKVKSLIEILYSHIMKTFQLPYVSCNGYSFKKKDTLEGTYQDITMKRSVDEMKNEISNIHFSTWKRAVKFTNPYENVVTKYPRQISRAYFKLVEIIKDFDLEFHDVNDLHSLHLCEGPGAFIEALIDVRKRQNKKLIWTGITLKNTNNDPNLPDFVDKIDMSNVCYGEDGTGDLTKINNIKYLSNLIQHKGMAHIVTADGGFDVSSDHCSQESQSYHLMLCQVVSALECQRIGGSFVMKVFDLYSNEMTELLYILANHYNAVYVTKPYSSRPCNSEKYIVCKHFRGISNTEKQLLQCLVENYMELSLKNAPDSLFVDTLSNINCTFSQNQKGALTATLAFAKKSQWVQRPKDMSSRYISHYFH